MSTDWFLLTLVLAAGLFTGIAATMLVFSLYNGRINMPEKINLASVPNVLMRLINSKKVILAALPVLASAIVQATGHDVTNWLNLIFMGFSGALVVMQFILDAINGSPSDGTVAPPVDVVVEKVKEKLTAEAPKMVVVAPTAAVTSPSDAEVLRELIREVRELRKDEPSNLTS